MKHREQRALVRGRWKYLQMDGIEYLFDLHADERERANLVDRMPERLAELRAAWQAWDRTMPPIPPDARVNKLYSQADMPVASA